MGKKKNVAGGRHLGFVRQSLGVETSNKTLLGGPPGFLWFARVQEGPLGWCRSLGTAQSIAVGNKKPRGGRHLGFVRPKKKRVSGGLGSCGSFASRRSPEVKNSRRALGCCSSFGTAQSIAVCNKKRRGDGTLGSFNQKKTRLGEPGFLLFFLVQEVSRGLKF